jgi:hypothetical protein
VADGVLLAESRRDRRLGVLTSYSRVLIRTRSVHSHGLTEPLLVVGLDGQGTVASQRCLYPKTMLLLPGAVWILELPIEDVGPEVGERLNLYARRCERQADDLWNTNRQPG